MNSGKLEMELRPNTAAREIELDHGLEQLGNTWKRVRMNA